MPFISYLCYRRFFPIKVFGREKDEKLRDIMKKIFVSCDEASKTYNMRGNYLVGANIAGFIKVAEAMKEQGNV